LSSEEWCSGTFQLREMISDLNFEDGDPDELDFDELNKKGLRTPTNKKWDKPKLSSYYNYIKKQYKLGKE